MPHPIKAILAILLCQLIVGLSPAVAGTRINLAVDQADRANDYAIFVENSKVRVLDQTAKAADLIYDAQSGQMTLLDHRRKSYMTLTQARIDEIASMVQTIGQIASQQGGVLGDLMSTFGVETELGSRDSIKLIPVQTKESIAGLQCNHVQVVRNDAPETVLCLTQSLPINAGDTQTLRGLLDFSQQLATKAGNVLTTLGMSVPLLPEAKLDGFPLGAESEQEALSAKVSTISTEEVDVSLFSVPKGYVKAELPI